MVFWHHFQGYLTLFKLYFFIAALAKIKFGSKNVFDDLTFLNDLKAKIATGNSVHAKIIFLHFIFNKYFITGFIIFSASFTFPFLTRIIDLLTHLFCNFNVGSINLYYLSKNL